MKVCVYVMTVDSGLAPNPFHGVCTLAVCTPNHARANLKAGDYILGIAGVGLSRRITSAPGDRKIIYSMQIDEVLTLGEYYADSRFRSKIPKRKGPAEIQCGDNFYKTNNGKVEGILMHTQDTEEHEGTDIEEQDCRGNRVFIGKRFNYFGSHALEIPIATNWAKKLIALLSRRSVGITYMYGGSMAKPWTKDEVDELFAFLDANKPESMPLPVDFKRWIVKEKATSQSSCS